MHQLFKKMILAVCYLLIALFVYTQNEANTFFEGMHTSYLSLKNINPVIPYKIKSITVKDNRPDTLRIGMYKTKGVGITRIGIKNVELFLDSGMNLQGFFAKYLISDTAEGNLLMVINHFYVSNSTSIASSVNSARDIATYDPGLLTFQAKIYIQKEGYLQGLVKIDTSFSETALISLAEIVSNALATTSNAIETALVGNTYIRHPKLSVARVDSINMPLKLSDSYTANGYYPTFNDFITGNLTNIKLDIKKLDDKCFYVYTVEKDSSETVLHDIWGAQNNGKLYIMTDGLLFPLYKINNGYYWKGLFQYYKINEPKFVVPFVVPVGGGSYLFGTTGSGGPTALKQLYTPCLLNMQTGVRY